MDVNFHSSAKSGWAFLEAASTVILKNDCKIIREAPVHSLILDSTNNGDDWVAVLARCVDRKGRPQIVLWDLVCMVDAKHLTFVETLLSLYKRDNVDVSRAVGWASDGCATMKKAAVKFEEEAGVKLIFCHCLAHRIDLALSRDMWLSSPLCKEVEEALRMVYSIFNRSSQRRKELQALANAFGKVRVPVALCEVRWLSKLNCLEIFAHPATAQALREYMVAKPPDRQSSGERHLLNVLEDRMDEVRDILRILRLMGVLTANLQKRSLDLPGALLLLNETKAKLTEMTALSDELASLRDDLLGCLGNRIPVQESTWLGFLKLGVAYPDAVVLQKFSLLQKRLQHLKWEGNPEDFLKDYKRVRLALQDMMSWGADARDIDLDMVTAELDLGPIWYQYRSITHCISPTSAEAERVFSCLSRLRSKFRRSLHTHLEACVRVSQAKTLGSGFEDDAFVDDVVYE